MLSNSSARLFQERRAGAGKFTPKPHPTGRFRAASPYTAPVGVPAMSKERKAFIGGRDSGTGRFITVRETYQRPGSTQREHIPTRGNGDTGRYDTPKKK